VHQASGIGWLLGTYRLQKTFISAPRTWWRQEGVSKRKGRRVLGSTAPRGLCHRSGGSARRTRPGSVPRVRLLVRDRILKVIHDVRSRSTRRQTMAPGMWRSRRRMGKGHIVGRSRARRCVAPSDPAQRRPLRAAREPCWLPASPYHCWWRWVARSAGTCQAIPPAAQLLHARR
jgi:hypothetical protein